MVYRLLFMFYIEARPELGYVAHQQSEVYLQGYSLESLRDLELQPLPPGCAKACSISTSPCPPVQAGGPGLRPQAGMSQPARCRPHRPGAKTPSPPAPLDSRLFDDTTMPHR